MSIGVALIISEAERDWRGAADYMYFLGASVRCTPPPGSNSAYPCARTCTARIAAACLAAIAAHRRISRRSATPRRARFTRAARAPLVTHAQASVPSRCRLAERVGPLLGTMREGACGAAGGSEAAAGEPGPARRWPPVTPRPAAPPETRLSHRCGCACALRAHTCHIEKIWCIARY